MESKIGLIGLGVMGRSLALNLADHGFTVSVYSREIREVEAFKAFGAVSTRAFDGLGEFISSLAKPRTVLLMITAGAPVDETIEKLLPLLESGDIIIDGGNSYFKDTIRRAKMLKERDIEFLGCGISGGEAGARYGASLMPGGSLSAWEHVQPMLEALAAKDEQANPCCRYIGPNGAGHFVKMVHNGIEYADMQLIGEAYLYMKIGLGMTAEETGQVFAEWNRGDLCSYLTGITADILGKRDAETGNPLVEMIVDCAGQKGTGKWTAQEALDLGVPAPTLAEAVFSRCMSSLKPERVEASKILSGPEPDCRIRKEEATADLGQALYAGKISVYAQGLALLRTASDIYGWNLDMAAIASVWRAGCIIQAEMVEKIRNAFTGNPGLTHLFLDPYFDQALEEAHLSWRRIMADAVGRGIPMAAMGSALAYYDAYRTEQLPANLLQAQRDYFGAHTYERTDCGGRFHTDWSCKKVKLKSEPV